MSISVGPNSYGHPAPETVSRLQAAGAKTWRTDQSGTITIVTHGVTLGVTPEVIPLAAQTVYLPLVSLATQASPPTPTPTPTPPPGGPMPGQNEQCQQSGAVEICASVSSATPTRYSTVTVYGRLRINGEGQAGQEMTATWHYRTTTSQCSGISGADGLASCSRGIGGATAGYQVNVEVSIAGYQVTTSFTPQ